MTELSCTDLSSFSFKTWTLLGFELSFICMSVNHSYSPARLHNKKSPWKCLPAPLKTQRETLWSAAGSHVEAFSVQAHIMSSFEDGCVSSHLGDSLRVPCAYWCGAAEWMSGRAGHRVCLGAAVKICSVCVRAAYRWQARARRNLGTCMCVVMAAVMCVVGVRIQV